MSDYRTSGEGGPDPDSPVMEDWDPNDPDTVRVHYDLAAWNYGQRAELAAAMADALIPHAWGDDELLVPEAYEDAADNLLGQLEETLDVRPLDDGGAPSDDGDLPDAVALPDGVEAVEYDLDDWDTDERAVIAAQLRAGGVAHRWEDDLLLVGEADEAAVDALLDAIEQGEYDAEFDVDDDDDESAADDDVLPFESLTTFFLAGERLAKNPTDADGLARLVEANELSDVRRPPYGVEASLWRQTRAHAERVVAALVDGDEPDTEAAQEAAVQLRDLLRPYI